MNFCLLDGYQSRSGFTSIERLLSDTIFYSRPNANEVGSELSRTC